MSSTIFHTVAAAAPAPVSARYSHAVEADGWLHVTGQLPVDPERPDAPLPGDITAQARLCFDNLKRIVSHARYALDDTVFVRIYLRDFDADFAAFNRVYDAYFDDPQRLPSRTTVGVSRLGRDARVEVDIVLFSSEKRATASQPHT
ncbi:RidA family protein [Paraburkholderia saeva]|uniref:RidA family protein n=1 Tax=Paraburkholderia saeva TaxID=2777537 RepID=UPI001D64F644|nr:RidA family protein [Paraburkholderia saeva]CAG4900692.1 2-iminobutanoate/2-iminopropanoate deaminase [Paraburkholderia saeva]